MAVREAEAQFGGLYQCKNALELADEGERFDVILLTEVIEHLSHPVEFIQRLSGLLASGGVLLATTPNKDYAPNSVSEWASDLPPVHLWWFGKEGFRAMARHIGLSAEFHSFRLWNRHKFTRALIKPPERIVPAPRLNPDGSPIGPVSVSLKPRGLLKKLESMIKCSLYGSKVDLDEGAIIGAIFRVP